MPAAYSAPADNVDCSKVDEVIEDLGGAQGITVLNPKYKLAGGVEEYTKRCKDAAEALKTLRKYNKECFSSLTQQVLSAILRTRAAFNEQKCAVGTPEFAEANEAIRCMAENSLDKAIVAEKKAVAGSEVLLEANISDEKLRLRHSCCQVIATRKMFLDVTKEKCSKYEKVYSDYADSYTSEAMSLICPEADKLECDKLEGLKIDGVEPKNKFFMTPMLKVVKTLDH